MSPTPEDAGLPRLVDSPEAAAAELRVEALVLACDLVELARITTGRLKETMLGATDLTLLRDGLTELDRTLLMTRTALEVATKAVQL